MGGSLAVEVFAVYSEVKSPAGLAGVSAYFRDWRFWLLRILVAAVAGGLATVEEASKPIIAVQYRCCGARDFEPADTTTGGSGPAISHTYGFR